MFDVFKKKKGPGGGRGLIPGGAPGVASRIVKDFEDKNAKMLLFFCGVMFVLGVVVSIYDVYFSYLTWGMVIHNRSGLSAEEAWPLALSASLVPTVVQLAWTCAFSGGKDLKQFALMPAFLIIFAVCLIADWAADAWNFYQGGMDILMAIGLTATLFYGLTEVGTGFFGAVMLSVWGLVKPRRGAGSPGSRPGAGRSGPPRAPGPGPIPVELGE